MRDGVLIADITKADGSHLRLASQMYADGHTLYRGHLHGFTQVRRMTDAISGRTRLSVANLSIHNQDGERDTGVIAGTADIRIGERAQSIAEMAPVMLDAPVAQIARSDNVIDIAVLDGQARGKAKQQRIFDTSGDGFGTLLPEIWGQANRFPLINLDGDTGRVYGCAGPLSLINAVYVDKAKQSSGYTTSLTGTTATVTFTTKPEGSVFIDAIGLGSGTLPGTLLNSLLTRISGSYQGRPISSTSTTITLDSRADDILGSMMGKTITLYRASGSTTSAPITTFDPATRIATISGSWSLPLPTSDDIYKINVSNAAGGFMASQIDTTGFDALDAALPYTFGLVAASGISAIRLQDTLLKPLLCHMAPRRDGIVQLKRLALPSGTPAAQITRLIGEIRRRPMPVYWHVEARYRADSTGGHWRSVSAMDGSIKADWPDATTYTIDVPAQERAAAQAIAQHWLACFGLPTEIATMRVDHDLTQLDLGDVIEVVDARYQFAGGKLATVVSMTDHFDDYDELGVWVPML